MSYFMSSRRNKKQFLEARGFDTNTASLTISSLDESICSSMKVKDLESDSSQKFVGFSIASILGNFSFDDLNSEVIFALEKTLASKLHEICYPGCSGDRHVFVSFKEKLVFLGTSVYFNENRVSINVPNSISLSLDVGEALVEVLEEEDVPRHDIEEDEHILELKLPNYNVSKLDVVIINGKKFFGDDEL